MKKSVKSIVSLVSAIAMLSTSAMVASADTTVSVNPIKKVNAAVCDSTTKFEDVKADAIVVNAATKKMEEAGYKILGEQFGTEADKDAIIAKVAKMDKDEIKKSVADVTKVAKSNKDIADAVAAAKDEVKKTVAAAEKAGIKADIVVSNVYNPITYFEGGEIIKEALAAVQVYVDDINKEIAVIAKESKNVTVADVSAIKPATKITADTIKSSNETAKALSAALNEQTTAAAVQISETKVEAEAVNYTYGDLNNDTKVKAVDLVIMLQYKLGTLKDADMNEYGYTAAAGDVYKDGKTCDASDIARLKLFLLEDIDASILGTVAL